MLSFKKKNGFTLIELVTVILLIGVISAITIPNILSWLPELRLKRAARDLFSSMVNVRMNAIKENKSWAIVFDTANNKYFICDNPGADGSWNGAGDATGTGDNNIVTTYCVDGSGFNPADPLNCSQRKSGVVLGSGDATIRATVSPPPAAPTAIPGDNVSFVNNLVVFTNQGVSNAGYVYFQHQGATTSFSVGTLTSGVVHVLRSAKGETGYVQ